MEDRVISILKSLKSIKPDEGFISRSRQMIFSSAQQPRRGLSVLESFKLAAALALASILLFVALGGLSYIQKSSSTLLTNAKTQANPDFEIQIGQAKYDLGNQTEVGVNIEEILKNLSL